MASLLPVTLVTFFMKSLKSILRANLITNLQFRAFFCLILSKIYDTRSYFRVYKHIHAQPLYAFDNQKDNKEKIENTIPTASLDLHRVENIQCDGCQHKDDDVHRTEMKTELFDHLFFLVRQRFCIIVRKKKQFIIRKRRRILISY